MEKYLFPIFQTVFRFERNVPFSSGFCPFVPTNILLHLFARVFEWEKFFFSIFQDDFCFWYGFKARPSRRKIRSREFLVGNSSFFSKLYISVWHLGLRKEEKKKKEKRKERTLLSKSWEWFFFFFKFVSDMVVNLPFNNFQVLIECRMWPSLKVDGRGDEGVAIVSISYFPQFDRLVISELLNFATILFSSLLVNNPLYRAK